MQGAGQVAEQSSDPGFFRTLYTHVASGTGASVSCACRLILSGAITANRLLPASWSFNENSKLVKTHRYLMADGEKLLLKGAALCISAAANPVTFVASLLVGITLSQRPWFKAIINRIQKLEVVTNLENRFDKLSLGQEIITGLAVIAITHLVFALSGYIPVVGTYIPQALSGAGGVVTGNWYGAIGLKKLKDYSVKEFTAAFAKMTPEKVEEILDLSNYPVSAYEKAFAKMTIEQVTFIRNAANKYILLVAENGNLDGAKAPGAFALAQIPVFSYEEYIPYNTLSPTENSNRNIKRPAYNSQRNDEFGLFS